MELHKLGPAVEVVAAVAVEEVVEEGGAGGAAVAVVAADEEEAGTRNQPLLREAMSRLAKSESARWSLMVDLTRA